MPAGSSARREHLVTSASAAPRSASAGFPTRGNCLPDAPRHPAVSDTMHATRGHARATGAVGEITLGFQRLDQDRQHLETYEDWESKTNGPWGNSTTTPCVETRRVTSASTSRRTACRTSVRRWGRNFAIRSQYWSETTTWPESAARRPDASSRSTCRRIVDRNCSLIRAGGSSGRGLRGVGDQVEPITQWKG